MFNGYEDVKEQMPDLPLPAQVLFGASTGVIKSVTEVCWWAAFSSRQALLGKPTFPSAEDKKTAAVTEKK